MTAPPMTTRTAETNELDAVTRLCLAAFTDEAVIAWIIPDTRARQEHMRHIFSTSLEAAIRARALILAINPEGDPIAASIWVPRTATPETQQSEPPSSTADDQQTRRMATVESVTAARHPNTSHLHLSSMATLPDHRGQGAGTAMITAGVARAQTLDLPIYLEASTSDNRRLYERAGFREHGEPIHLPEGGPSLQPMWLCL